MVLVFAVQSVTGFYPAFEPSSPEASDLVLSFVSHADAQHLMSNMFFLAVFGSLFERVSGRRSLLSVFLLGCAAGGLSAYVFYPSSGVIGASAGLSGIMVAFGVFRPKHLGVGLGVPMPMWAVVVVYGFINLSGITGSSQVAYEAHIAGGLIGGLYGCWLRDSSYFSGLTLSSFFDFEDSSDDDWEKKIREWEEQYMLD